MNRQGETEMNQYDNLELEMSFELNPEKALVFLKSLFPQNKQDSLSFKNRFKFISSETIEQTWMTREETPDFSLIRSRLRQVVPIVPKNSSLEAKTVYSWDTKFYITDKDFDKKFAQDDYGKLTRRFEMNAPISKATYTYLTAKANMATIPTITKLRHYFYDIEDFYSYEYQDEVSLKPTRLSAPRKYSIDCYASEKRFTLELEFPTVEALKTYEVPEWIKEMKIEGEKK